jgi:hypothetical protein
MAINSYRKRDLEAGVAQVGASRAEHISEFVRNGELLAMIHAHGNEEDRAAVGRGQGL